MHEIAPAALKRMLLGESELALIDVREQGAFAEAHLLFAVCVPLSSMELVIGDLVPRNDTPVVVVAESADDDLGRRAWERLGVLGYTDVRVLAGGLAGWRARGLEVFSGVNVPSKAFGEFVEETYGTPRVTAGQVKSMLDEGRDVVVVDSRPYDEYHRMNIPSSTDMPGAELALRIHDVAPDPGTFVVVNCAGRTRSIIGTQSLINAGIENRVAALKDGTMGWHLAGFELEHAATRVAPLPGDVGIAKALAAAERVAERFGVPNVERATLVEALGVRDEPFDDIIGFCAGCFHDIAITVHPKCRRMAGVRIERVEVDVCSKRAPVVTVTSPRSGTGSGSVEADIAIASTVALQRVLQPQQMGVAVALRYAVPRVLSRDEHAPCREHLPCQILAEVEVVGDGEAM